MYPKCVQDWSMNLLTDLVPGWAGNDGSMCDWMGALEIEHRQFPYRIRRFGIADTEWN